MTSVLDFNQTAQLSVHLKYWKLYVLFYLAFSSHIQTLFGFNKNSAPGICSWFSSPLLWKKEIWRVMKEEPASKVTYFLFKQVLCSGSNLCQCKEPFMGTLEGSYEYKVSVCLLPPQKILISFIQSFGLIIYYMYVCSAHWMLMWLYFLIIGQKQATNTPCDVNYGKSFNNFMRFRG